MMGSAAEVQKDLRNVQAPSLTSTAQFVLV